MVMIDVGRVFDTLPRIRQWAINEVIPQGPSFNPLEIQAQTKDYHKAKVRWMSVLLPIRSCVRRRDLSTGVMVSADSPVPRSSAAGMSW
jgi:hypothetical protein